jgi:predicted esterase
MTQARRKPWHCESEANLIPSFLCAFKKLRSSVMNRRLLSFLLLFALPALAQPAKSNRAAAIKPGEWSVITFQQSVPLGEPAQLKMRMHSIETPGLFDVSQEQYQILVPKGYKKTEPHGLFIWVSAGNGVSLPKEWEAVLADKKLIAIGARNSGNNREVFDRMRLALDANDNLRNQFNVDDRRVYVSGFSGGSRVASMLGVTYADMFTGALCFMGVNFYEPTFDKAKQEVFQARYIPNDEVLALAKQECRYVMVTGEKDFNLINTQAVFDAFKSSGFKAVEMFNIPGQGHQPPAAEWLKKGIEFLDQGKAPLKK